MRLINNALPGMWHHNWSSEEQGVFGPEVQTMPQFKSPDTRAANGTSRNFTIQFHISRREIVTLVSSLVSLFSEFVCKDQS